MQKIVLTALSASILMTGVSPLFAESNYYELSKDAMVSKQQESSSMRAKYYQEYKIKGYDMAPLEAYLDASKTSDGEYWAAFKVIKDKKEIPERRSYVAKLQGYGYDVSGFTETVIWDSGKFWEMVKMVESGKKSLPEVKKEEYKKEEYKKVEPMKNEEYKKIEPVKQEYKEEVMKKVEEKKTEMTKKVEDKAEVSQKIEEKKSPAGVKITAAKEERLVNMMKARIAKIPESSRESTLLRLQDALTKGISVAEARNAKLLVARYQILLSVVQAEMENVDDEVLINSLFQ